MNLSNAAVIYMATVSLLGLLLLLRALWSLRRTAEARLRAVGKRNRLDAVGTESPVGDPTRLAKQRAQESIEKHFTVTRRLLVPLIIIVTLLAAAVPLLREVPAAFLTLIVTAVTVLIGIAARPFVENAIGGLILSSSRLVRIGDTVSIDELYGTVEDITLTHTTVKIWDWRRYVIPNSHMLQSPFVNMSLCDKFQWAYVEFWVAYDADIDLVQRLAIECAKNSDSFSGPEEPHVWVMDLEQSGYRCWVAAWANTPADAWMLKSDIRVALVKAFREHGIATHRHTHDLKAAGIAVDSAETPASA